MLVHEPTHSHVKMPVTITNIVTGILIQAKREPRHIGRGFYLERMMGIEPTQPAWEAGVLPLNYTRL